MKYGVLVSRRAGMRPIGGGDTEMTPLEGAAVTEDCDDLDLWQRFHETVQDLPVEEHEVVSLISYHGWSQLEVAGLFGVHERTVRRRWRSACVQLQERLGGRFPGKGADGSADEGQSS